MVGEEARVVSERRRVGQLLPHEEQPLPPPPPTNAQQQTHFSGSVASVAYGKESRRIAAAFGIQGELKGLPVVTQKRWTRAPRRS